MAPPAGETAQFTKRADAETQIPAARKMCHEYGIAWPDADRIRKPRHAQRCTGGSRQSQYRYIVQILHLGIILGQAARTLIIATFGIGFNWDEGGNHFP